MNHFTSIRIEGAIFSSDILEKLDELKGQKPADFGFDKPVKDEIARAWADAQDYWRIFQRRTEGLSEHSHGTTETRNAWMVPLLSLLGYKPEVQQKGEEVMGRNFAISHRDLSRDGFPIHIMGCRDSLDQKRADSGPRMSPHGLVQEYLNLTEHLYAIVTNGLQLRLLRDSSRLVKLSYIEFDLDRMFTDGIFSDFAVLYRLLHATRMPVNQESTTEALIEGYHQDSLDSGSRIRDGLSNAVRNTIEQLGSGFLRHPENEALRQAVADGTLTPREFYHCNLRLVYRILFLMVAEDRNLLFPSGASREKQKIYYDYYSLSRLRRLAEKTYLSQPVDQDYWISLHQLFRLFENEELAARMDLVPLGGMLFNEESLGLLAESTLDNRSLSDALRSFTWFKDTEGGQTIRVNYAALNVEELGSIYEFLLEMTPELKLEQKSFSLVSAAGNDRKTTGSYYTPECLVSQLLKTALDPVIDQRTKEAAKKTTNGDRKPAMEEALLKIKVCDPACGSGHFLIGAANRLARRLCEVRFDGEEPSPQAYRHALREVITHCIYGVDINPMSVELCKVSLWMEAMEPGKPLGFLDHHIKCGNSLLGTTPALLSRGIPDEAFNAIEGDDKAVCSALKKRNKEERESKGAKDDLFAFAEATWSYQHAFEDAVKEVESLPDDDIRSLEKKQLAYEEFLHSTSYTGGKRLHDAWCAAFVCSKVKDATTLTHQIVKEMQIDPNRCPKAQQELIDRLAAQYKFFHWHIEFPDVFQPLESIDEKDSKGWKGGFDCMLGNPPWEHTELKEKEWFASRNSGIANADTGALRKKMIQDLATKDSVLYAAFHAEKRIHDGVSQLNRLSGVFPLCGRGRVNTYAIFAELFKDCISKTGRSGVIVPSGICTDDTTKFFFQDLVESKALVSLFDFENRRKIFAAVDSRMKFCLLTMGGEGAMPPEGATFSFFALDVEDLKDDNRVFTLSAEDIELINPNTRTCPIFRARRDAELTKAIYRRVPVLIREARDGQPEQNPWGISFKQGLFNMTSDSHLFHTREQLEAMGYVLEGNIFTAPDGSQFLPLYEAKMFHHFNHRFGDYADQPEDSNSTQLQDIPVERLQNPNYAVLPRYWVAEPVVQEKLADLGNPKWLCAFRDITNTTNERTAIFSIIPPVAVGHTSPLAFAQNDPTGILALLTASFAFDFVVRQKVGGTHLTYGYLKQIAALHPDLIARDAWLTGRFAELSKTSSAFDDEYSFIWDEERRFEIRCELDAAFFHLYGIDNEDDVDYIMETFPIVKRKDEKHYGTYRTKNRILEIYREMARCTAEGQEYQSALNPPPGPPADAEGNFIPMSEWDSNNWPTHIHQPKDAVSSDRKVEPPKPPAQTVKVGYPRSDADKVLCSVALQIIKRSGGVESIDLTHALLFTIHPQRAGKLLGRTDKNLGADKITAAINAELHVQQMRATLEASGAISIEPTLGKQVLPGSSIDDTLIALKTNIGSWPECAMEAVAAYKAITGGDALPTKEQEAIISSEERDIAAIAELWSA